MVSRVSGANSLPEKGLTVVSIEFLGINASQIHVRNEAIRITNTINFIFDYTKYE